MGWSRGRGFPRRMDPNEDHAAEWRDAEAYAPLLEADRSIFAWEWLRRDPGYRDAARQALQGGSCGQPVGNRPTPERWGLHTFEPPHLGAPDARPVWGANTDPYVLKVHAGPPLGASDSFELAQIGATPTIVTTRDGHEHLLISDGLRAIRIDVLAGSLKEGPVRLHYRLAGLASAEKPLVTLRRLLALWRTGRFSAALHSGETRARRFVLMLRAHDAIASGATQREIAAVLLSAEADVDRWRVNAPTVRSRAQRLVRNARAMAAGGYVSLLRA